MDDNEESFMDQMSTSLRQEVPHAAAHRLSRALPPFAFCQTGALQGVIARWWCRLC